MRRRNPQQFSKETLFNQFKMMFETKIIPSEGFITNKQFIKSLMIDMKNQLKREQTVVDINDDVSIFGDIHGNFEALRNFMEKDPLKSKPFVFLGDYIDRGTHSLDVICFLFICKLLWPSQFILLRGNHEDINTSKYTQFHSFYKEMNESIGNELTELIFDTFNYLPIACVVKKRMLCLHGGISKELKSVEQLRSIQKPYDISTASKSLASEIVWADPLIKDELIGRDKNIQEKSKGFVVNRARNYSWYFTKDRLEKFLRRNNLEMLCRAHQRVPSGACLCHDDKCMTVFSSPQSQGKDASIVTVQETIQMYRYSQLLSV